jgi:hypothetical protein
MTQLELISKSVRISAVEQAMEIAECRIRIRRAAQHRFQPVAIGLMSPMHRARSGSNPPVRSGREGD